MSSFSYSIGHGRRSGKGSVILFVFVFIIYFFDNNFSPD